MDKFAAWVISTILMGYSMTQKGYKLLSIKHSQFFVSRDVVFKENIFPFMMPRQEVLDQLPSRVFDDFEPPVVVEMLVDSIPHVVDNFEESSLIVDIAGDLANFSQNHSAGETLNASPIHHDVVHRNTRSRRPPSWHLDYAMHDTSSCVRYPLSSSIFYVSLSPS